MRFCSFASGSSSNCEYAGDKTTNLLLDAGVSTKRIVAGLDEIGVEPGELDGIFVTHEHSDHIKGLVVFESKYNVPIYATGPTLEGIERYDKDKRINTSLFREIKSDQAVKVGTMEVVPFATSHDSLGSVCYTVKSGDAKIGLATDLGVFDEYIVKHLSDSQLLFIEANYDVAMLQAGKYPFYPSWEGALGWWLR